MNKAKAKLLETIVWGNPLKASNPKQKKISLQEAIDRKMFGPVYHGTTPEGRKGIEEEGFYFEYGGMSKTGGTRHGYGQTNYHDGIPAPVHHLGYGVYLTTVKSIAKRFNNNSEKGLKTYYIDTDKILTINFAAHRTMMKWWQENGYDMPPVFPSNYTPEEIEYLRSESTVRLTQNLSAKYDAVWFKGKTLYKALDGDQIVVFDPSIIYEIDSSLSKGLEIGAKVIRVEDGMPGVIIAMKPAPNLDEFPGAATWIKPGTKYVLIVRWKKGGTDFNVQDVDVKSVTSDK